ncbi:MAG TPA: carbohydrate ABC transporter permease [Candidatus Kapabacteria bacterium]|nr:carbohydrate ABC transporter permease [Candidatus Kapabacteria bacterium]
MAFIDRAPGAGISRSRRSTPPVRPARMLLHGALLLVLLGMIFPLAWMIVISLRESNPDLSSFLPLLAGPFSLHNYSDVLSLNSFGIYFLNSMIVAAAVTLGNVVFCTMVGYALARRRMPMKRFWTFTVLAMLMVPPQVVMIPLYRLIVAFHWIDTYWALIVPSLVTPFGIFLMRQYIENLPSEIEDAARIDGAGDWRILFRIIMPLSRPMLIVLAVYQFMTTWNTFLYPFLFANKDNRRTLTVGLASYLGNQSIDWGHLMAGASVSAFPVIILFIVFQKQIIQGMTAGAVKG